MIVIAVSEASLDPAESLAALEALGGGAVASFTGVVRGEGGLTSLHLEHYPAMSAAEIDRIVAQARARWPLLGVVVRHRVGTLAPGERIVFVGTAARHRGPALEACAFLIDWLKTGAPFWKKERYADGRELWVEPRAEDAESRGRWVGEGARDAS